VFSLRKRKIEKSTFSWKEAEKHGKIVSPGTIFGTGYAGKGHKVDRLSPTYIATNFIFLKRIYLVGDYCSCTAEF
jgi:hypothetical protein